MTFLNGFEISITERLKQYGVLSSIGATKKQIKKSDTVLNFEYELTNEEERDNGNLIVKRKSLELKPMDEEEAILQLELLGHDFFIYKDVKSREINILYKRKDGNYGVIETND